MEAHKTVKKTAHIAAWIIRLHCIFFKANALFSLWLRLACYHSDLLEAIMIKQEVFIQVEGVYISNCLYNKIFQTMLFIMAS